MQQVLLMLIMVEIVSEFRLKEMYVMIERLVFNVFFHHLEEMC